jgi:hypothetical protein
MHHTLAAAVLAEPQLNTNGIVTFVVKAIVPIIFVLAAVLIMSRAHKGQTAQNVSVVGNLLIGVVLLAGAGAFVAFGGQLVTLFFGG